MLFFPDWRSPRCCQPSGIASPKSGARGHIKARGFRPREALDQLVRESMFVLTGNTDAQFAGRFLRGAKPHSP